MSSDRACHTDATEEAVPIKVDRLQSTQDDQRQGERVGGQPLQPLVLLLLLLLLLPELVLWIQPRRRGCVHGLALPPPVQVCLA